MSKWTSHGAVAAGAVLLGLSLSEVLASPYSIFAVLAGTGLLVDGVRRICQLRRPQGAQDSGNLRG
ncbi:hypothetical protein ACWDR0_17755 [Streptomyces sp. NPDC003691]